MQKRGVGNREGRDLSRERAIALRDLERYLEGVDFPLERRELIARAKDIPAIKGANGDVWDLKDILTDVPVDTFSSPKHVAEVVRLRWEDMYDLFRPGGPGPHGKGYSPSDAPVQHDVTTAKAVAAHDRAERESRERRAGP